MQLNITKAIQKYSDRTIFCSGESFEGAGGRHPPPPPKERKKEKREKGKKKKERKKGTMNNVELLHIKCCFFQFFTSPVALKNLKKNCHPQEKVEMTPLFLLLGC